MLLKKFPSFIRPAALLSLPMGLILLSGSWLPVRANSATDWNQFDVCTTDLINSGVNSGQARSGCAGALIPKQLSECVTMIRNNAPIAAEAALKACYQVRRPVDLGNCVVDIQNGILGGYTAPDEADDGQVSGNDLSNAALNTCQKSLLPGRQSECVISLSRDGQTASPLEAMNTCLAAEDFPRDLFPAYSQSQPKAQ